MDEMDGWVCLCPLFLCVGGTTTHYTNRTIRTAEYYTRLNKTRKSHNPILYTYARKTNKKVEKKATHKEKGEKKEKEVVWDR